MCESVRKLFFIFTIPFMGDKTAALRKILSMNIKIHRERQGLTQEKLGETAGISANMNLKGLSKK